MSLVEGASIILYDDKKRILLQLRDNNTSIHPNTWGFFGGAYRERGNPP